MADVELVELAPLIVLETEVEEILLLKPEEAVLLAFAYE